MYSLGCGTRKTANFETARKVSMWGLFRLASALRLLLQIALALSAPVAFAQGTQPGAFDNLLGTITKSATNALQGELDKALNKATGGSTNGSVTQSQGSSAPPVTTAAPPPPAGPAQGFSPPLRPDEKRASQATIDEAAKKFQLNCTVTSMKNLHDCECLARGYRETAARTGRGQIGMAELAETCPAPKQTTYQWVYRDCDDYMQHKRTDHADFCSCTANRFSSSYVSHPNSNLRKVEALRRESMTACGLSDRTKAIKGPASTPMAQVSGAPSLQPQGTVENSSAGSITLPSECFSSNFNGSYTEIRNSCKNNYMLLLRTPDAPDRCFGFPADGNTVNGHNTAKILRNQTVVAVCMQRGVFSSGSCSCPTGSEFTARDLPPLPGGEGFPSGRNGCPVDKKDPRWAKLRPGDVCYR